MFCCACLWCVYVMRNVMIDTSARQLTLVFWAKRSDMYLQIKSVELHVAKSYGTWQATVLEHLQASFNPANRTFSPDALGQALVDRVKAAGTAGDVADKALKGLCIPFARLKYDEATLSGAEVGPPHPPFTQASFTPLPDTTYL
jgi:hypothetical protein